MMRRQMQTLARKQRRFLEKRLAESAKAVAAMEADLEANWDREMIYQPAQRKKEALAKARKAMREKP